MLGADAQTRRWRLSATRQDRRFSFPLRENTRSFRPGDSQPLTDAWRSAIVYFIHRGSSIGRGFCRSTTYQTAGSPSRLIGGDSRSSASNSSDSHRPSDESEYTAPPLTRTTSVVSLIGDSGGNWCGFSAATDATLPTDGDRDDSADDERLPTAALPPFWHVRFFETDGDGSEIQQASDSAMLSGVHGADCIVDRSSTDESTTAALFKHPPFTVTDVGVVGGSSISRGLSTEHDECCCSIMRWRRRRCESQTVSDDARPLAFSDACES